MSTCHESIRCPECAEMCTRHEPCCAGTPQCECVECETCSALVPELTEGRCGACDQDARDAAADARYDERRDEALLAEMAEESDQ